MATLRDIKRRIVGVKNTQKITKAMKMVATAKLRRAQQKIISARPYAGKISEMLLHLVSEEDIASNYLLKPRDVSNLCVVVVTADRGLCGAFNTNIIKEAVRHINEETQTGEVKAKLVTVGKKATDYFSRRNYEVIAKNVGLFSSLQINSALQIYNEVLTRFNKEEFDKVVVIYNQFVSMVQQKITVEQVLPIPIKTNSKEVKSDSENYIFEPDQKSILNYLLPKQLKSQFWKFLLESNAAELGARMTAMDNATTNAQELIRSLNITYNKERQASITKEILEIVSGANALKASS
ncbi:MAG: ATP synthase F1 subunit gamma [Ignavibacteria bacterium]|nr:ATP synthase F1 subunit gamma [Ignavibacteria bacterium]MBT8382591.1 ATP synthase F1 subunit gamma [Ignavibacteria bacterium]MBT8391162.1 ATP synthase F1 subunit gamma [Ignavibacteria bacterium]NNJ54285.1 ATP synthase F1 subunit gamma [Ignavibacteriaceae bacterium]NNL20250.1 ATP synthase F1 subunit gamma [Ignavibacteriaceae bacterium]